MSSEAARLALAIHGEDPWAGYFPDAVPDVQGWGSDDPIFAELVGRVRPRTVLEVGTWKGASAITICDQLVEIGLTEAAVVCVDTWLGAREMIGVPSSHETRGLRRRNGYPELYRTFLSNVVSRGHKGHVVPFPQTSQIALRWLGVAGERFDLIYLDASHDEQDVRADFGAAWSLLRGSGSVLFGDDYDPTHWPGVVAAITSARLNGFPIEIRGRFWVATRA